MHQNHIHFRIGEAELPPTRNAAEGVILGCLLFAPELLDDHLDHLHPAWFTPPLWQSLARAALWQVRGQGACDVDAVARLLARVDHIRPDVVDIELDALSLLTNCKPGHIAGAMRVLRGKAAA